ncbi:hypothetical protein pb186bvf_003169 [Paramecium bursaria]
MLKQFFIIVLRINYQVQLKITIGNFVVYTTILIQIQILITLGEVNSNVFKVLHESYQKFLQLQYQYQNVLTIHLENEFQNINKFGMISVSQMTEYIV